MNIEPSGAVRKPAPHTENIDDDAMIAELYSLDEAGLLAGAAPTTPAAIPIIRTSRQVYLGQTGDEIKAWANRWCKDRNKTSGVEGIRAYVRALYKLRPEHADDPEGYRDWKARLSGAQEQALEVAHEARLDRDKEDYAARALAEEGRVVKHRQRNPTPERKTKQNRDRQAKCMAKKTVEERQEIGRKARANQPAGYEAARKREQREKKRQEKLAAAVAAVRPSGGMGSVASQT